MLSLFFLFFWVVAVNCRSPRFWWDRRSAAGIAQILFLVFPLVLCLVLPS